MSVREGWRFRRRAAQLILQRDLRSMIFGPGIYVVLSLSLAAAALIIRNSLNFVAENGLLVLASAFHLPLLVVILLTSLFLALSSVTMIAREREQGTMEVLFYGPVDRFSYILGKYLAHIVTYFVAVVIYGVCFVLFAGLTNLALPLSMIGIIILSVLTASGVIALGMFLSTLSSSARAALFLFLGIILVFIAIQVGHELLENISPQSRYYDPMLFLKSVVSFLLEVTNWVSPFAYLNQGMTAVERGSGTSYLLMSLISVIYAILFLGLSVVSLERKGVRR